MFTLMIIMYELCLICCLHRVQKITASCAFATRMEAASIIIQSPIHTSSIAAGAVPKKCWRWS